jgi:hypothetical protein
VQSEPTGQPLHRVSPWAESIREYLADKTAARRPFAPLEALRWTPLLIFGMAGGLIPDLVGRELTVNAVALLRDDLR